MSNDLISVFILSVVAMVNPTLLAAMTAMLLMPKCGSTNAAAGIHTAAHTLVV